MYTTFRTPSVSALNSRMSGGSSEIQYTEGKYYTRKCMNSSCHSSRYLNALFYPLPLPLSLSLSLPLSALSLEDDVKACANPEYIGNWMEWVNCIVSTCIYPYYIYKSYQRHAFHAPLINPVIPIE